MPKSAIIELDTAVTTLRLYARSIVAEQEYERLPFPADSLLIRMAHLIFDDILDQVLPTRKWNWERSQDLVEEILRRFGWTYAALSPKEFADSPTVVPRRLIVHLEKEIAEYVHSGLIQQITDVVGPDRYHAWHSYPVGSGMFMTPGGILLNVSRLNIVDGIVEVNLDEHWGTHATTADELEEIRKHTESAAPLKHRQRAYTETKIDQRPRKKINSLLGNEPVPTLPEHFDAESDRFEAELEGKGQEIIDEPATTVVIIGAKGEDDVVLKHPRQ